MSKNSLPDLNIPRLLKKHDLHPSKGLGQNFLADAHPLRRIVELAEVGVDQAVLEIGPGLGSLTRHLALAAHSVTAVELDRKLIPVLEEVLSPYKNVRIVQGDILEQDPGKLMGNQPYVVVANIPYYITSAVIRHLLESGHPPLRMVLTVQKEVAERICVQSGKMSLLALSVQVYGQTSLGFTLPAQAFIPAPKVDSAVVSIQVYPHPLIPVEALTDFFTILKAGFSQKRKTLRNALSGGLHLAPGQVEAWFSVAGLDPQRRAETLSLEEWRKLVKEYRLTKKDADHKGN